MRWLLLLLSMTIGCLGAPTVLTPQTARTLSLDTNDTIINPRFWASNNVTSYSTDLFSAPDPATWKFKLGLEAATNNSGLSSGNTNTTWTVANIADLKNVPTTNHIQRVFVRSYAGTMSDQQDGGGGAFDYFPVLPAPYNSGTTIEPNNGPGAWGRDRSRPEIGLPITSFGSPITRAVLEIAIGFVEGEGGGALWLPKGTHFIDMDDGPIEIHSNVAINSQIGGVFTCNGGTLFQLSGTNIGLAGFGIDLVDVGIDAGDDGAVTNAVLSQIAFSNCGQPVATSLAKTVNLSAYGLQWLDDPTSNTILSTPDTAGCVQMDNYNFRVGGFDGSQFLFSRGGQFGYADNAGSGAGYLIWSQGDHNLVLSDGIDLVNYRANMINGAPASSSNFVIRTELHPYNISLAPGGTNRVRISTDGIVIGNPSSSASPNILKIYNSGGTNWAIINFTNASEFSYSSIGSAVGVNWTWRDSSTGARLAQISGSGSILIGSTAADPGFGGGLSYTGQTIRKPVAVTGLTTGSQIPVSATHLKLSATSSRNIISTPSFVNLQDGIEWYCHGTSDANTITFNDESSVSGTLLHLGAATRVLASTNVLHLYYDQTLGFIKELDYR